MRVAHIIMAHKNPNQLVRLIEKLSHDHFDIYIHLDAKSDKTPYLDLLSIPQVYFIKNRVTCNWGGFSFVQAIFSSVTEVLQNGQKYKFINLLSAQDYPIYNSDYIYDYLQVNKGLNFISFDKEGSDWWIDAKKRYQRYHFTDTKIVGKYLLQSILNRLLPKRKMPMGLVPYGSSDSSWWTLSIDCASYICNQFNESTTLKKFFRFCWGTDEFVIATLVMNSPYKSNVVNNNLRYIDWSEGGAHPKTLTTKDLEKVLHSKKIFARKFDINVDHEILDLLDQHLLKSNKYLRNTSL